MRTVGKFHLLEHYKSIITWFGLYFFAGYLQHHGAAAQKEEGSSGGECQGMVSCHFSYRKWLVSKPAKTRFFYTCFFWTGFQAQKNWEVKLKVIYKRTYLPNMRWWKNARSFSLPQLSFSEHAWDLKNMQTHDHSCKSNLRHISTDSAPFCSQGTWSPAALHLLSSCTSWGHVWADDCNLSQWQ